MAKFCDSIGHKSLFYRLWNKVQQEHWILLCRGYGNIRAYIKWAESYIKVFKISQETRQGSCLSPRNFCRILNDDLLKELDYSPRNLPIGDCYFNCHAFADDNTIISTTHYVLRLQIDICVTYAA